MAMRFRSTGNLIALGFFDGVRYPCGCTFESLGMLPLVRGVVAGGGLLVALIV
jgi:hypothetical protein